MSHESGAKFSSAEETNRQIASLTDRLVFACVGAGV